MTRRLALTAAVVLAGAPDAIFAEPTPPASTRLVLAAEATGNLSYSDSVVGQADVLTVLFGGGGSLRLDHVDGQHDVRVAARASWTWAYTRATSELTKNSDIARIDARYVWWRWADRGLVARLEVLTHAFPAEDVRPAPFGYAIERLDGTTSRLDARRLPLAEWGEPATAIGTAGVAYRRPAASSLAIVLGAGSAVRGTAVRGTARVLVDDPATPVIEVREVTDVRQLGAQVWAELTAGTRPDPIQFDLQLSAFVPVWTDAPRDRTAPGLVRIAAVGQLDVRLASNLTLAPRVVAIYDRQFVDALQLQTVLLARLLLDG